MTGRLRRLWFGMRRRLGFRASLYGLAAVGAALIAAPLPQFLPTALAERAADAPISELLTILASSMLAVATFSLGAMVTAFGTATSNATPRAARVLIDDPISQNALSTFIGAFVYAIVGLIALSVQYYGDEGHAVMLLATVIVIAIVIATLFGWVDYLTHLSRLGAVVTKLEERASQQLAARVLEPYLGALGPEEPPFEATPIRMSDTGYLAHIDVASLDAIAVEAKGAVHVAFNPGRLVDPMTPIAHASWAASAEERQAIAGCFSIEPERSLDQDPRYTLIVIGEVASRALSPGVNDPGTAIGVISRLQRLLTGWVEAPRETPETRFANVRLPGLEVADLVEDAFGPLARDGAPMVEVGLRLQKSLLALARLGNGGLAEAAAAQSARAFAQAEEALVLPGDRDRLAAVSAQVASEAARLAPVTPGRHDAAQAS